MQFSDVDVNDMKMAAQVVNILQHSSLTASGKDICAAADGIRWMQSLAVAMAEGYRAHVAAQPKADAPPDPVHTDNSPPLSDGPLKIRSYNPGKPGKK